MIELRANAATTASGSPRSAKVKAGAATGVGTAVVSEVVETGVLETAWVTQ